MCVLASRQVLSLYKSLLRYSQQVQYTDKAYFYKKIKSEFKLNKNLDNPGDINHYYNKGLALLERHSVL
ncbi:mitochondrial ribosome and complex I assembly factor AltMIEF1 [Atheta coriaria]|uniref:mitochondrial ribosome and complex I assembly factor AltMIEF1 n=1 Tax=Dalotia coriaria TaxID=877792 RepID=UPI0031F3CBF5